MTKRYYIIVVVLIFILAVMALALFLRGDEDTWLCQDGQWVKHGNPSAPMPTLSCGTPSASFTPTPFAQSEIEIYSPKSNEVISSLVSILGQARGSWFFEAVFPIKLLDDKGNLLASGQAQAQGDWMTEDFVPFTAQLSYILSATSTGVLIFNNDNPSGLSENSKEFRVPVIISPSAK